MKNFSTIFFSVCLYIVGFAQIHSSIRKYSNRQHQCPQHLELLCYRAEIK